MALQAADENSAAPIVKPFWRVAIKQRKPKTGSGSLDQARVPVRIEIGPRDLSADTVAAG
jgi:hypothetical protein